jgi:hypothetical protein
VLPNAADTNATALAVAAARRRNHDVEAVRRTGPPSIWQATERTRESLHWDRALFERVGSRGARRRNRRSPLRARAARRGSCAPASWVASASSPSPCRRTPRSDSGSRSAFRLTGCTAQQARSAPSAVAQACPDAVRVAREMGEAMGPDPPQCATPRCARPIYRAVRLSLGAVIPRANSRSV